MWIAKVIRTERNKGDLDIIVTYSKDDQQFDLSYHLTTAQPDGWLDDQINAKLTQLNDLDTYEETLITKSIAGKSYQIDSQTSELVIT